MNYLWCKIPLAASVAAASLIAGCGGGGGSSDSGQGTLRVSMTDAPSCGYDQVNVTVSQVRVHKNEGAVENDAGWSDITLSQPRKINLLDLTNGVLETLGQTSLPAGQYRQMRLVLSPDSGNSLANSVVPTGGSETALKTPSAIQSGIKLNGQFDVAPNTLTDVVLDFDACKSVVTRGNGGYNLKPVISVIPLIKSGAIDGYVDPAIAASGKSVVSAQDSTGLVLKSTVPDSTGRFSLSPLVAGNYTVVITGDARATDVIGGVPVQASAHTQISTSAAPISLEASAVNNAVSGTVAPVEAQATVSAIQTLGSGAKVTIKYANADALTGAYSMTLPAAAPMVGQYSATLPIGLTPQAGVAGKYTVEATATTYSAQVLPADITAGPVLMDFILAM